jgi:mannose-6-phosphate isomerase-like protein (cupin superfamily)
MDKFAIAEAVQALADQGEDFARLFQRPDFDLSLYKPSPDDPQTPHRRDELYIVARGSGIFLCAAEQAPFGPGDVFFVAAGVEHRFLDFSADFSAWVIFFGTGPI